MDWKWKCKFKVKWSIQLQRQVLEQGRAKASSTSQEMFSLSRQRGNVPLVNGVRKTFMTCWLMLNASRIRTLSWNLTWSQTTTHAGCSAFYRSCCSGQTKTTHQCEMLGVLWPQGGMMVESWPPGAKEPHGYLGLHRAGQGLQPWPVGLLCSGLSFSLTLFQGPCEQREPVGRI